MIPRPCYKCGHEVEVKHRLSYDLARQEYSSPYTLYAVVCPVCGITTATAYQTPEGAIRAWNGKVMEVEG